MTADQGKKRKDKAQIELKRRLTLEDKQA